ncbi:MAG: hypothetical protein ABDK87_08250 [Atribacterota bacterium]
MKFLVFLVFALGFLLVVGPGFTQDAATLLQDAAVLVTEGKLEEAQALVEEAYLALWNKAPLTCPVYLFVEGEPEFFGVYRERPSRSFVAGETMHVYAKPKNYTILKEDNIYHVYLSLSYSVYDKDGKYLGGEDPWENFRYVTYAPTFELFLSLSFSFELDPGEYTLEITVEDKLSDKETSFKLPFKRL